MGQNKINHSRFIKHQLCFGLIIFFFSQCNFSEAKKNKESENDTKSGTEQAQIPARPSVSYHLISTRDSSLWLKALTPGDTLQALLVVNRIDRSALLKLDTLVFPDSIGNGTELYAPFPKSVDELRAVRKILFVSHYAQAFAVYEDGQMVKWGPVSLGKQSTPTPTGLFATNWKAKSTISTVDSTWIMDWYFNLDNFQGVSMHQYALPGYPASHACIRLYNEDAYWLHNWADQWILANSQISVFGTPVIIFGAYPFGERKPWLLLAENNKALDITASELMLVAQEYLITILERQAIRDSMQSTL